MGNMLSFHIFSWPDEAEEVAAERIKAASKKRLLGTRFPARDTWYHRKCLSRVYFMCPLLLIAALAMLKSKIIPAIEMHSHTSSFMKTSCTTSSANLTDVQLICDCRKSKKEEKECRKQYPCLVLGVTMETKKGLKVTTTLYEDIQAMIVKYKNCAVFKTHCPKHDPTEIVDSMYEHYGEKGQSFSCLYNPAQPREVLLHIIDLPNSLWIMLGFLSLLIIFSFAAPVIAYLTCGCMYVCTKTPPADIQREVERRAVEGGPLTEPTEEPQPQEPPADAANPPPTYQDATNVQPVYSDLNHSSPTTPAILRNDAARSSLIGGEPISGFQPSAPAGGEGQPGMSEGAPSGGAPPLTILYVYPGNVVSTVPPPGVTPLKFQPTPSMPAKNGETVTFQ